MKNLLIVESPTKVKSIEKFLGKDFKVLASVGHVRDLMSSSRKGIDVENNYEPVWSCLLYTSPSPRDGLLSRMPSSA